MKGGVCAPAPLTVAWDELRPSARRAIGARLAPASAKGSSEALTARIHAYGRPKRRGSHGQRAAAFAGGADRVAAAKVSPRRRAVVSSSTRCDGPPKRAPVASRLLLVVQPSSARPVEPVRRDSSFAEKQESYPALLLVVRSGRIRRRGARASFRIGAGASVTSGSCPPRTRPRQRPVRRGCAWMLKGSAPRGSGLSKWSRERRRSDEGRVRCGKSANSEA
jgi:hypothetical protein